MAERIRIGDLTYVVMDTGGFDMSPEVLFANADPGERAGALARHGLADPIRFHTNALLVDTGTNRVLVDPGGLGWTDGVKDAVQEEGIDPTSIDTIVVTHGHADHYWGCVGADRSPAFPNAKIFLTRREWEHWMDPDNPEPDHAANFREILKPLEDQVVLLEGEGEIVPGVEAIDSHGHSSGHLAVLIDGRVLHTGDAVLNIVYIEHPEWVASFELLPEDVVASRRALLGRAADEGLVLAQCHFPMPGLGRIERLGDAFRWQAVA
ncbi:MAG: MBL fold metallo-hydrolase [Demequinaceae bacterium]|nr:MBL fold metallo-hydrolase [Demequinaceae bacterium]